MRNKIKQKREQGFTIIEVMIVLAIAGLIMLIVFLAVPALQRNARNTQRNDDASRTLAAVNECLSNRNNVTSSCDTDGEIEQGTTSQLTAIGTVAASASTSSMRLQFSTVCDAAGAVANASSNARQFTLTYQLEPAVTRCIGSE
jgi:prepilin-type N-terminal cleavage/methylation domain-containing protein